MTITDDKYYKGYDDLGEQAIQFFFENGSDEEILYIWEGYFSAIMHGIPFKNEYFYGLIKEYHEVTGWYDDKWEVPDITSAVNQLKYFDAEILKQPDIKYDIFEPELLYEILGRIIQFLERAKDLNCKIYMERD
ncbi:hypothetical protein [Sebaldella sp. S0638]|uniref:hypothetical protein n=1 Tax=Sebaldella sp. S0638 TaxID=2957809 RepID=UPI0020A0C52D|nr:hypothetical protein [Sebaldella sp. S0638]MCP1226126.1 hypothetical protein [Sebaldella sp. S0638]